MKKTFWSLVAAVVCTLSFSSCASVNPVAATSVPVGNKKGVATELRIFGIPFTEAGLDKAAKEGNIKKISHVESRTQFLWPAFGKRKTVVYGE